MRALGNHFELLSRLTMSMNGWARLGSIGQRGGLPSPLPRPVPGATREVALWREGSTPRPDSFALGLRAPLLPRAPSTQGGSQLAWTKKRGETKDGRGRYLVSWRDPSGRHRGRTIIGRNEALAFKREVESALVASTYVDPRAGKVKVGEYAARWIDSNPRLGDRTRERYRQLLRTHVGPALGDVPVNRVRPTDVEALVTRVLGAGRSPGTARKVRNLISAVFRSAVRDGLVGRSPVEGVAIPPEGREEQRFLSAEQVDLLASTPLSIPGTGPSSTSARTGASGFGELAGLKINRLRILERRVDVVWQVTEEGGRLYEGAPKWGSAPTVTIPPPVAEGLPPHLAA